MEYRARSALVGLGDTQTTEAELLCNGVIDGRSRPPRTRPGCERQARSSSRPPCADNTLIPMMVESRPGQICGGGIKVFATDGSGQRASPTGSACLNYCKVCTFLVTDAVANTLAQNFRSLDPPLYI